MLSCIGSSWNFSAVRIAGLAILVGILWFRSVFDLQTSFEYILKTQLVFIFILDAMMPSISTLFFFLLSLSLLAMIISMPKDEYPKDRIKTNEILLGALDKMMK